MDIQKIKELALANGFSLKEQASGNMDLNSYVYEFAQAVKNEVLAQARSVFNQEAVTVNDTEFLDAEITQISESMSEKHYFDNGESEELEMLVAKAMKLGELYERQKWQEAKAQEIPEGFVLVKKSQRYFSHDFNGDGFKYHDTLKDAEKEAEANLDYYRDRVADGHHVGDDGEFNELCYGVVVKSADYNIDDVVTKEHHVNGEYTQYEIGTEILSLNLYEAMIEAQEQGHENK